MAVVASPAISARIEYSVRPLVWWHLLSLDAPTLAVLWCALFSAAAHVHLPIKLLVLLAIGVWAIYVLDRILDGFDPAPGEHLKERHFFYARHRMRFVPLLAAAGTIGAVMLFRNGTVLLPATRHDFLALAAFLVIYYLLIHAFRRQTRWFPKEFAVGVFFSSAIAVPTWVRLAQQQKSEMILPVLALGVLCWLNCIAITRWEASGDPPPQTRSFWPLSVGCLAISFAGMAGHLSPIIFAIITSTVALLWLEWNRTRFSALSLRIAADCALLTPLFVLPLLRR
ncbi:MAG TPA: hypothetical protein VNX22_02255 [Acidobacteriaceae bacterium]|jgi:hypothetical protein|nr:hypothetical protein [Acidobacteriaceae bacterium]